MRSLATELLAILTSTNPASLSATVYLDGAEITGTVKTIPPIRRRLGAISPEDYDVTVSRGTDVFSGEILAENSVLSQLQIRVGAVASGGTLYEVPAHTGKLSRLSAGISGITFGVAGKFGELSAKTIGNPTSLATYAMTNPGSLAWSVVTCYGTLSSVASISNADIDFASASSWTSEFASEQFTISAEFGGETVAEALAAIGAVTDSDIYTDIYGRLVFRRTMTTLAGSAEVIGSNQISDLTLEWDSADIINAVSIPYQYDTAANSWAGGITAVSTTSQGSYGTKSRVLNDQLVWHDSAVSATNVAQRIVARGKTPPRLLRVTGPLALFRHDIGDNVAVAASTLIDSLGARVTGYEIDWFRGTVELELSERRLLRGFILDDSVYGLLDKDYNPLV